MSATATRLDDRIAELERRLAEIEQSSNAAVLRRARAARDANIAGDLTGVPEDQRAAVIAQRRSQHYSAKVRARWAKRVTADAV
jgi:hypothetical protein